LPELFCVGNALVDIFADVPPDFCKRFGLTETVQHISAENAAAIFSALPSDIAISSGGNAANTAKIAAARLGVKAAFAGAVGGANGTDCVNGVDRFGALFEEELTRSGVSLYLSRKNSQTGLFFCLRENTDGKDLRHVIAASPSAALELDKNDIDESLFAQTKILYIESFLLERKDLVSHFLNMAEKYRLTLAMDAGTPGKAAEHAKLICSWFSSYPFVFFMNEKEAESFADALNSGSGWEKLFMSMSGDHSNNTLLVVKLAERGAAVFHGGAVYHAKTEPVVATETTGAGDAFAAGFLAALLRGEAHPQCAHAGNVAASGALREKC
jgi:sugar/nucleoside kinase (ribokinase family)